MTQLTPQSTPQPTDQSTPHPIASMPVFKFLAQYIQAAASGNRDHALSPLSVAIFAHRPRRHSHCLVNHYKAHPRAANPRHHCGPARLLLCPAPPSDPLYPPDTPPNAFLTPAQLRALTRARAVLAHMTVISPSTSPRSRLISRPRKLPAPAPLRRRPFPWRSSPHSALRAPFFGGSALRAPHFLRRPPPAAQSRPRPGLRPPPAFRDLRPLLHARTCPAPGLLITRSAQRPPR